MQILRAMNSFQLVSAVLTQFLVASAINDEPSPSQEKAEWRWDPYAYSPTFITGHPCLKSPNETLLESPLPPLATPIATPVHIPINISRRLSIPFEMLLYDVHSPALSMPSLDHEFPMDDSCPQARVLSILTIPKAQVGPLTSSSPLPPTNVRRLLCEYIELLPIGMLLLLMMSCPSANYIE